MTIPKKEYIAIYYNHEFWEKKMLPNLNKFQRTSLLPEAVREYIYISIAIFECLIH